LWFLLLISVLSSTSSGDYLERLVAEMFGNVSSRM